MKNTERENKKIKLEFVWFIYQKGDFLSINDFSNSLDKNRSNIYKTILKERTQAPNKKMCENWGKLLNTDWEEIKERIIEKNWRI